MAPKRTALAPRDPFTFPEADEVRPGSHVRDVGLAIVPLARLPNAARG
jgi:hypothetical protein